MSWLAASRASAWALIAVAGIVGSAQAASAGAEFADCRDCPRMVRVPRGRFTMGSPGSELDRKYDESPAHDVAIPSAFALGTFEVTRREFAAFVAATGYEAGDGGCLVLRDDAFVLDPARSWRDPGFAQTPQDPVVCVSWWDAQAYVSWLNAATRHSGRARPSGARLERPYRLPSEAEWEYAARAGTATRYWWGDDVADNGANCATCGSSWDRRQPAPVGSFAANAFGLRDMHGNVAEWVDDCYVDRYGAAPGRMRLI